MGSLSLEIIIKFINHVYFKDIGWLAIIQTVWETKTFRVTGAVLERLCPIKIIGICSVATV